MSKTSGPKPGVILGAGAKPPFAVLPDPSSPFSPSRQAFRRLASMPMARDGRKRGGRIRSWWGRPCALRLRLRQVMRL
jgi:hypothetical protein